MMSAAEIHSSALDNSVAKGNVGVLDTTHDMGTKLVNRYRDTRYVRETTNHSLGRNHTFKTKQR